MDPFHLLLLLKNNFTIIASYSNKIPPPAKGQITVKPGLHKYFLASLQQSQAMCTSVCQWTREKVMQAASVLLLKRKLLRRGQLVKDTSVFTVIFHIFRLEIFKIKIWGFKKADACSPFPLSSSPADRPRMQCWVRPFSPRGAKTLLEYFPPKCDLRSQKHQRRPGACYSHRASGPRRPTGNLHSTEPPGEWASSRSTPQVTAQYQHSAVSRVLRTAL